MATGYSRYRGHKVWETLSLKRESLHQARYDDAATEQWRMDIVEWLTEAAKTKLARQPALYLSALEDLSNALNSLPIEVNEFKRYITNRQPNQPQYVGGLESALRALPLPPPRELNNSYVAVFDQEAEARTARLEALEVKVQATETSLQARLDELTRISGEVDTLRTEISDQRKAIAEVSSGAEARMTQAWDESLSEWNRKRKTADEEQEAEAVEHVAALAATRLAAQVLAEHAAGDLTATDWAGRARRERRSALWIRFGAVAAFIFAGALGWYIVNEAIRADFDLTVGDGILRASVATVVAAFGALLLRESGRHFKEADTAEDVALSLRALAPFYANSEDGIRLAARERVGDAVLVRNVLSRFANRDAAKHAGDIDSAELKQMVSETTRALDPTQNSS